MSASDYVTLRGGLIIPVPAVLLALELERRGCHLRLDADDLVIGPRDLLTDDDRLEIIKWRLHLKAIASYTPPEIA